MLLHHMITFSQYKFIHSPKSPTTTSTTQFKDSLVDPLSPTYRARPMLYVGSHCCDPELALMRHFWRQIFATNFKQTAVVEIQDGLSGFISYKSVYFCPQNRQYTFFIHQKLINPKIQLEEDIFLFGTKKNQKTLNISKTYLIQSLQSQDLG